MPASNWWWTVARGSMARSQEIVIAMTQLCIGVPGWEHFFPLWNIFSLFRSPFLHWRIRRTEVWGRYHILQAKAAFNSRIPNAPWPTSPRYFICVLLLMISFGTLLESHHPAPGNMFYINGTLEIHLQKGKSKWFKEFIQLRLGWLTRR